MRLADRLRALDNKVLGRPKPVNSRQRRNAFLLGLIFIVIFLGTALITGEPQFLTASGGLWFVTAVNGYFWAQGRHTRP